MKQFPTLLLAFGAAACGPQQADYDGAMERYWPKYLADQRRHVEFYEESIAATQRLERLDRLVPDSLSTPERREQPSARLLEERANLEKAQYFAQAKFERTSDVSCTPAQKLPGDNCELTVRYSGPDGELFEERFTARFHTVDGRLELVGEAS